jgi:antirestriction protein ArdC
MKRFIIEREIAGAERPHRGRAGRNRTEVQGARKLAKESVLVEHHATNCCATLGECSSASTCPRGV